MDSVAEKFSPQLAPGERGVALVVDDEPVNCKLLGALLRDEGFQVRRAETGEQAVEIFASERVDIIFMDVLMPIMNGYQATRAIKEMAGDDFVPIIFLSALDDKQVLASCIEAGGDDFLIKPFNALILKARIRAAERVRDLHRKLAAKNKLLANFLESNRQEQELAEQIFSRMVENNAVSGRVVIMQRAANIFSGDLALTARHPDGSMRILLGDFTGHGLVAAIAALPVVNLFQGMTQSGGDEESLLLEINTCLHDLLPVDRFMCACLVTITPESETLQVWNCGMPPVHLLAPEGRQEISSRAIPLGIHKTLSLEGVRQSFALNGEERLLLLSDGFTEASDESGKMFGEDGLSRVLDGISSKSSIIQQLKQLLDDHCRNTPQRDDITVVEVCAGPTFKDVSNTACC